MRSSALLFLMIAMVTSSSVEAGKPAPVEPGAKPLAPMFQPLERAVSTWRDEAAGHLLLAPDQAAALRGPGHAPAVARCVKLNNYWCIKRAGWNGELAADTEGHVAFASAVEGAAVAALLLKRYYVDFGRRTAMAIISHWAPTQCGKPAASGGLGRVTVKTRAPRRLGNMLRARWLAGHSRGIVTPVADRVPRMMATPLIAVGLGEVSKPITLDALMMSNPNAPPSRSMIGMPRVLAANRLEGVASTDSLSGCGGDSARVSAYAAKATVGVAARLDDDLALFDADGTPTKNLSIVMANMARVEIGPLGPTPALVDAGIAAAFKPVRNPDKS